MDLNKSLEFFDPANVKGTCHVIGCGSIGSNVAELLARYGIEHITIWDFDTVEPHNIANQLFTEEDVGKPKTEALAELLYKINPKLKKTLKIKGKWNNDVLSDYVFMCVDSVDVRRDICKFNEFNPQVKAVFDFRTTLLEGQCYFADWRNPKHKKSLLTSLDFTHEEALANTPVSACGFTLSVAPVVKMCAIMGIANFTNYINEIVPTTLIICNPYTYNMISA